LKLSKLATSAKAQRTAVVVNAKLLANLLAKPAAASQTNNAKTKRSNLTGNAAVWRHFL
jgi:hypothetical protein